MLQALEAPPYRELVEKLKILRVRSLLLGHFLSRDQGMCSVESLQVTPMAIEKFVPLKDYSDRSLAERAYEKLQQAGFPVLLRHLFNPGDLQPDGSERLFGKYRLLTVSQQIDSAGALIGVTPSAPGSLT